jgi:hypothetical protein
MYGCAKYTLSSQYTYTINLIAGQYYPILLYYSQGPKEYIFGMGYTPPDGKIKIYDGKGKFFNQNDNYFSFFQKIPSSQPSSQPSFQPSSQPTRKPSLQPTSQPSSQPSSKPSTKPLSRPSSQPSSQPSLRPSSQPSRQPSSQPSSRPSKPSSQPSSQPSSNPTKETDLRTFVYTGSIQYITVPLNVNRLNVSLWGAGGGSSTSNFVNFGGGSGGYTTCIVSVTPGETLTVIVGGGNIFIF